jgi:anti-sigma-K factor RskA
MNDDSAPPTAEELRRALAGEIALGLLHPAEASAALASDPSLAAMVARFSEDLAGIGLEVAPVTPSPDVLSAVTAAIAAEEAASTISPSARKRATSGGLTQAAAPSGTIGHGTHRRKPSLAARLAASLMFWKVLTATAFATASALGLFLSLQMRSPEPVSQQAALPPSPRIVLVSALLPRDGTAQATATFDRDRGRLVIIPVGLQPSSRGVHYLWLVPNDDGDPIGLGALDPNNTIAIDLDTSIRSQLTATAGLVITLEPALPNGSSEAQGPVIAHGKFTAF